MGEFANSLRIEPIGKTDAIRVLAKHPLGPGSKTFSFAFGLFWEGKIQGVQTWGNPAVNGAGQSLRLRQSEILELRKFWVSDVPPRNTESRALAVAARLIKRRYPQIRMLLTYCEAGEKAASYRASGWILTAVSRHANVMIAADGREMSVRDFNRHGGRKVLGDGWKGNLVEKAKYVYVLDPTLAPLVQRQHAGLPARRRRFNSDQGASVPQSQTSDSLGRDIE